ncbi:hypothetical protein PHMEG_00015895 [Phytophthora megakarya]|uniref:Uncharacterized protein n=1 Tax=Phytophthora megakarya TaxID=4795 RepID=A0A225W0B8_9STRA|nr:hypothetical protein PHMEG_00015895 [Phytophthora megakarya]
MFTDDDDAYLPYEDEDEGDDYGQEIEEEQCSGRANTKHTANVQAKERAQSKPAPKSKVAMPKKPRKLSATQVGKDKEKTVKTVAPVAQCEAYTNALALGAVVRGRK